MVTLQKSLIRHQKKGAMLNRFLTDIGNGVTTVAGGKPLPKPPGALKKQVELKCIDGDNPQN
jgi:hypothetical protein